MSRRRADPITTYAAGMELAAAFERWKQAERDAADLARRSIDAGVHSDTVSAFLDMERSTFYRWLRKTTS